MFAKFSRSWELVKASAAILRSDKELLVFPVLSSIATLIVLATFVLPAVALNLFVDPGLITGVFGFIFYLCQYFVIFFFNSALVGAALIRLQGGDPTLRDGFNAATSRLGAILGYAAIAATVGLILQAMKNKDNNFLIRMLGSGLGAAWTLSTFLVVPVLVAQNVGPIDAIKQSVQLLKRTWGENAIGQVGIGLVFGLLMVLAIIVGAVFAVLSTQVSVALAISIAVIAVLVVAMLAIVQAALAGVYSAALYRYASDGKAPQGFEALDLQNAFANK